ncbi:DUF4349 domain-containing protein [Aquimarina sp. M1]
MKTNILKLIRKELTIGCLILSFSCSQAEKSFPNVSENIVMEETAEILDLKAFKIESKTAIKNEKETVKDKLQIIKNANCRIKVNHVEKITMLSKEIVSTFNGYVADEHFTNTNYAKENSFTIRVPKENFDKVLDSICALAVFVDYKNISTKDVTEEYIDISSRLKTKLEVKQRYEEILKTRAKTVKDILLIESNLRMLQEEIEASQGRLNYLSSSVSYSTIQFDLYETVIPKKEPNVYEPEYMARVKSALSFGWSLLEYLVLVLFYIWPLCIMAVIIFIYFKWIRK